MARRSGGGATIQHPVQQDDSSCGLIVTTVYFCLHDCVQSSLCACGTNCPPLISCLFLKESNITRYIRPQRANKTLCSYYVERMLLKQTSEQTIHLN